MVLAHGFGTDQSMWARFVDAFAVDRSIVLFDHVGSGGSDRSAHDPVRHSTLHGYVLDLVALLDELALPPVVYVGHSAGAMIGALAAVARPDLFAGVVMVGGSPRYIDDGDYTGGFGRTDVEQLLATMESNYVAWSRALAPLAMGNADRPELAEELAASFVATDRRIAMCFARAIFLSDHRPDIAGLTVPTLVVQPSDDPMVPSEVADYLHRHIPGSTLARLTATGHFPHMSGPDETATVVGAFLRRLP